MEEVIDADLAAHVHRAQLEQEARMQHGPDIPKPDPGAAARIRCASGGTDRYSPMPGAWRY